MDIEELRNFGGYIKFQSRH